MGVKSAEPCILQYKMGLTEPSEQCQVMVPNHYFGGEQTDSLNKKDLSRTDGQSTNSEFSLLSNESSPHSRMALPKGRPADIWYNITYMHTYIHVCFALYDITRTSLHIRKPTLHTMHAYYGIPYDETSDILFIIKHYIICRA